MRLWVNRAKELSTVVHPIPSKLHTQLACAAGILSRGKTIIKSPLRVHDTRVLLKIGDALGVVAGKSGGAWIINPPDVLRTSSRSLDAKNSGTALSLATAIAVASRSSVIITGDSHLRTRGVRPLLSLFQKLGAEVHSVSPSETPPLVVFGSETEGGRVACSLQECRYLPAALLLLPFAKRGGDVRIPTERARIWTEPAYQVLKAAGARISCTGRRLVVLPGALRGFEYDVPLEASASAPYVLAPLLVEGEARLDLACSTLRDRMFFDLLKALGCVIRQKKRSVSLKAPKMRGAKLDLSYVPELFPFFAVLGALSRGITRITGAGEARHMKSDRIAATARALRLMGAKIVETKDGVIVKGSGKLKGAEVDGAGDYAVSAALVLAALRADGGTEIKNAGEALRRAYPSFVATLRKLGAEIRLGAR